MHKISLENLCKIHKSAKTDRNNQARSAQKKKTPEGALSLFALECWGQTSVTLPTRLT
jgi:hypothetical protein